MNDLLVLLGLAGWKPVLTALLLPPVPLLLLMLAGARVLGWRRGLGWSMLLLGAVLLWLSTCWVSALALQRTLLQPPPALTADAVAALKAQARTQRTAVLVLGGGADAVAPEYGVANLSPLSMERLRYGVWLSKALGVPLAYSGGVGFAQRGGPPEAEVAERIAAQEFNRPLRWKEGASRDTRENALHTLRLLKPEGLQRIVVVTHAEHLPRALRDMQRAAQREQMDLDIVGAPIGPPRGDGNGHGVLRWLPSNEGFALTRRVLREVLGLLAGA